MAPRVSELINRLQALPPDEQVRYAGLFLQQMEQEQAYQGSRLAQLMREAKAEVDAGATQPLDEVLDEIKRNGRLS